VTVPTESVEADATVPLPEACGVESDGFGLAFDAKKFAIRFRDLSCACCAFCALSTFAAFFSAFSRS
jgi:hypothetical protein